MQVLNRRPGRDHQGKYDAGYEDLAAALRRSAAPLLDARRAFRRLAAYVLLGNVDCHMKNWSLLETPSGMRLAPVYDALNGYIYAAQGYTTRFGLEIDGERRQWDTYDRALLLDLAERLGLGRRAAETALAAMRWDEIADRLVTIASNAFNVFVAEMGFHDMAPAQRPGVPEGSPTPNHRVFEPPPPVTGALPALGDEPLLLEQRYFIDWGVAFLQAGLANLSYGGGRELDEAQNRALGDILSNLSVDRLLAGPIRPA